jgi:hypothetical protein
MDDRDRGQGSAAHDEDAARKALVSVRLVLAGENSGRRAQPLLGSHIAVGARLAVAAVLSRSELRSAQRRAQVVGSSRPS